MATPNLSCRLLPLLGDVRHLTGSPTTPCGCEASEVFGARLLRLALRELPFGSTKEQDLDRIMGLPVESRDLLPL